MVLSENRRGQEKRIPVVDDAERRAGRLRVWLRKLGANVVIHTVRGVGYMTTTAESENE